MQVDKAACFQLVQSLWGGINERIQRLNTVHDKRRVLKQAHSQLMQELPLPSGSPNQQKALEILRAQACIELFCKRRIEKLKASALPDAQKQNLIADLALNLSQSQARLSAQWPVLTPEEEEILPLLLMRQSLEEEFSMLWMQLKKEADRQEIA